MLTDYVGATSRVTPERGLALSADAWGWMPKLDGIYARVSTDRRGRIFSVLSRAGTPVREARDLIGFDSLKNVPAWLERGLARPAVQRGLELPARG